MDNDVIKLKIVLMWILILGCNFVFRFRLLVFVFFLLSIIFVG